MGFSPKIKQQTVKQTSIAKAADYVHNRYGIQANACSVSNTPSCPATCCTSLATTADSRELSVTRSVSG